LKKSDFQLIGYIGTVLGVIFLVCGIFAASYSEYLGVYYPYAKYSVPLLTSGIVLLVIGLAFLWRATQEVTTQKVTPQVPKSPEAI